MISKPLPIHRPSASLFLLPHINKVTNIDLLVYRTSTLAIVVFYRTVICSIGQLTASLYIESNLGTPESVISWDLQLNK
jgi:hypothetical protein